MRPVSTAFLLALLASPAMIASQALLASEANATPLTLYDADKDPLAVPGAAFGPVVACGGLPANCPVAPAPKPVGLPFTYGLAVSGEIAASNHGSVAGAAVSGWIKPNDMPLAIYFDIEHFTSLGRQR